MRIALFATDQVGLQIARFLAGQDHQPVCLVLDGNDAKGMNAAIQNAAGLDPSLALKTDQARRQALAEFLTTRETDLCVLAWWPYLLDPEVLAIPRRGFLNLHPSLLPYGRGKAPNFWSLREGTPFGVSIHWVDEGIDSGDIAFQRRLPVTWADNGQTLYERAANELVSLFIDHWPQIKRGEIPREPQPANTICHYQRELDAASQIDLDAQYSGRELLDLLRARTFPPHPAAWFEADEQRYEVRVSITPVTEPVV